jgi:hypothetical protein
MIKVEGDMFKSLRTRNISQYEKIHLSDPTYGQSSVAFLDLICSSVIEGEIFPKSVTQVRVIDFGCGKSKLVDRCAERLGVVGYRYDPAINEFSSPPKGTFDLLINTDVLEHLDEDEVDLVLHDIASLSNYAFFNISTRVAGKFLPNGENAHATVRPATYWRNRLKKFFPTVVRLPSKGDQATFITWKVSAIFRASLLLRFLFNRLGKR